ncbi:MAG: AAA family ATPase [Desulfobulbus sp.]|nr:AAA family ATPase [Desulfobulbus sp.]
MKKNTNPPGTLEAFRTTKLFGGDWSEFESKSHGDLALCRIFISNGITTPQEIDKMFRESGLMDKKWERSDYRDRTINKAIALEVKHPKSTNTAIVLLNTMTMIISPPPDTPWVMKNIIPKGQIGEILGDGKIGKSSLLFQMAMVAATGISLEPFYVERPQKVLVVNVEDPRVRIHEKLWHLSRKAEWKSKIDLLEKNLFVVDGLGKIGPMMKLDTNNNPVQTDCGKKMKEFILELRPDLVILDTKSRLYGLDENNNDHATRWLFPLEKIANEIGCSFIIAHHTGKQEGKTTGRGASAFDNNTRFRLVLMPMPNGYLSKFQIDQERKEDYFVLSCHSNYSEKSKIFCFKRGEAGIPILMNFAVQRWHEAETLLLELLKDSSVTKQQLMRNNTEEAKKIREQLSEVHKITAKECGTLLDNLENNGRITFKQEKRGKGKIILSQ